MNEIKKQYEKLKKDYDNLNKKYHQKLDDFHKMKKKARDIKFILERDYPPIITALFLCVVGFFGFYWYGERLIIELGIIGFFGDLFWELYGTSNGIWKYKKSKIFMIKGVPVEIPILVFSMGIGGATIILFLLPFF